MAFESVVGRRLFPPSGQNSCELELRKEIMAYRAREKDNELNKQLLKEVILKYSQTARELVKLNKELTEKQLRLHQNLEAAAEISEVSLTQKPVRN